MNASLAALQACLEKEAGLTRDFLQILQDEAKVLEDGATEESLQETTARKNDAADALSSLAQERNVLLKTLGFEADGAGLAAAAGVYPELSGARETLLDLTAQARDLNESNGQVINIFLEHNQRTLDTLRRLTGVGDIYDASGRTLGGGKGSSRNIKAG